VLDAVVVSQHELVEATGEREVVDGVVGVLLDLGRGKDHLNCDLFGA
jgi:hypothetical protein